MVDLLLLRRILRLAWTGIPISSDWRRRIVLHRRRRISETVPETVVGSRLAILTVQIRSSLHSELLQGRLIRSRDQKAAIECGVIDELPFVILLLLVEFADRSFLTKAGDSDDWCAAECRVR